MAQIQVGFHMDPYEWEAIQEEAARYGMKPTAWLRQIAREKIAEREASEARREPVHA